MKTPLGPDAYGYTIFCEDIRQEVDGKLTYVGVFGDEIRFTGEFPVQLPRMALGIVYIQRRKVLVPPSKIFVFLPGDEDEKPSVVADLPQAQIEELIAKNPSADPITDETVTAFRGQIGMLNLPLMQAGMIKVRAVRNDCLVRLGAIKVVALPPSQQKEAAN